MQDALSLSCVYMHTHTRRCWLCLIQPASVSSLSLMGWEMAVSGAGMINTTCCVLLLENENVDSWTMVYLHQRTSSIYALTMKKCVLSCGMPEFSTVLMYVSSISMTSCCSKFSFARGVLLYTFFPFSFCL